MEMILLKEIDKNNKSFENVKHIDENGVEFWYARELQSVLNYKEWRKFENVINKAKESCKNSDITVFDHFVDVDKMVQIGSGAERKQKDDKLTRYACYSLNQTAKNAGVKNFDRFHNYGYKGLYKEHYQQGQLLGCAPLL